MPGQTKIASRIRTAFLLLFLISTAVCWLLSSCNTRTSDIHNVILISIDTCRADYLSCYGHDRQTTPNIDKLAQESIFFSNAYTTVPLTLPAHSTLLTGTIPPYHGVHDNIGYKLDESNLTLAEILGRNEFTTAAVISSCVLDSKFGLKQGFKYYDDRIEKSEKILNTTERTAEETNRTALEWIDRHKNEKFFLLLHYYDPHQPYESPEPFSSRFAEDPYAGEIAYTDYCIGNFLDKLRKLGLYDSALIVITSDHGEMLGEHGENTHSFFIYESALKVPLIIKLPGLQKAKKIDDPVGLIDIVPTVCSLLGIQTPPNIQGKDLSPYFNGKQVPARERHLYCESLFPTRYNANSLLGVVAGRWKFIQTTRPELYDLIADPGETNNLVDQQPNRTRIFKDVLRRALENSVYKDNCSNKTILDDEDRKRLESLGYLASSSVREDFDFNQNKTDPKDLIDFHRMNCKGIMLINRSQLTEAGALYEKMLKEFQQSPEIHYRLADIASKQNKLDEATKQLKIALQVSPESAEIHLSLGSTLAKQGRLDEAITHFNKALDINPMYASAHKDLGTIFTIQGNINKALHHFSEAVRINPEFPVPYKNLGDLMRRQGKFEDAIAHYSRAVKLEPDFKEARVSLGEVYFMMGSILLGKGEINEAIGHLQKSLQINSNFAEAHTHLGYALLKKGKQDEAILHFNAAIRIDPEKSINAYYNLACIYARKNRIDESVDWLKKAVDKGFNDWNTLETDEDLENIRNSPYYKELIFRGSS